MQGWREKRRREGRELLPQPVGLCNAPSPRVGWRLKGGREGGREVEKGERGETTKTALQITHRGGGDGGIEEWREEKREGGRGGGRKGEVDAQTHPPRWRRLEGWGRGRQGRGGLARLGTAARGGHQTGRRHRERGQRTPHPRSRP